MAFTGLKVRIVGTLVFLLTIAILLGNIVVVMFWQKSLVISEVEHVREFLEYAVTSNSDKTGLEKATFFNDIKTMCDSSDQRCAGLVFYDGRKVVNYKMIESTTEAIKIARTSALAQSKMTKFMGSQRDAFFLNKKYLLIAHPLSFDGDQVFGSVVTMIEFDSIYALLKKDRATFFVYLFMNVLLLSVIGFFRLTKITIKPIEKIVKISESYKEPDGFLFSEEEHELNEFGRLSIALNSMLQRIESDREKLRDTVKSLEKSNTELLKTQKEMIRTEKMASVGRLSAGLAHEIGNPVGIVQGYVELLLQAGLDESDKLEFVRRSLSELDRINKLIRQLLDYAGSSEQEMSKINLARMIDELDKVIALHKDSSSVSLIIKISSDYHVKGDKERLRQVFLNCLLNALDAIQARQIENRGKITISAEMSKGVDGEIARHNLILIKIEDNGIGIHKEDFDVVFDPFFTTKEPGKGTGLGLFVSHSIIEAHGGRIWFESEFGKGTTIYIELPTFSNKSSHC